MTKNFTYYVAWTDVMKSESGFAGLIGYQHKKLDASARILWVLGPHLKSESDAENSAEKMLDHIRDINCFGKVIYSDGVML